MSKHTPGPWFHSDTSMWGCVTTKPDGHGHVVAEVGSPHTGRGRLDPDREEESKANARLIAAAPALLAALRELADIAAGHIEDGDTLDSLALQLARDAIAKAEGR